MYENIRDGQYRFRGSHASRAEDLVNAKFFGRIVDVLMVAPLVGFEYKRRAEENRADNAEKSVFPEQLQKANYYLELNYKTIMLLDEDYEPDENVRADKAFRVSPKNREPADLERYESYVRGGVDLLYEKLIGEGSLEDERLMDLYYFVEDFYSRHYLDVISDR